MIDDVQYIQKIEYIRCILEDFNGVNFHHFGRTEQTRNLKTIRK